jgi:hypothetical protein
VLDPNAVFQIKSDNFVARKIEQETILVPLVSNVADMTGVLTLNEVASSVFDLMNGKNTIHDILLQLFDEYSVEREVLELDVEQFINQAQARQLIEKV